MSEFDITEWCDFVRGVVDPETERRMRQRLAVKPSPDLETVAALRRVTAVGRSEADHPVPEGAVRIAKAIGSLQRPVADRGESILRRLPFTVIFDSLSQGAGAGARSLQDHSLQDRGLQDRHRQITFEAESYSVDVQVEHELEPPATVVVGQVTRREEAGEPVSRLPILLTSGKRIVGRAVTGSFGEFQAEGLPREDLSLCLLVGQDECLELPLAAEA